MKLPGKTVFWYLIFLLIGFSIIFFNQLGWLNWFHRLTQPVVLSLHTSINQIKVRPPFFNSFSGACFEQNEQIVALEKEVARLSGLEAELKAYHEENEASRRLLGAPLPAEWQFLPVKIIKVGDSYFIDQGKRAGIELGWPMVWENVYLGQVIAVEEQVSRVELVGQEGSKVFVKIKVGEAVQAKGILYGLGKNQAEVRQLLAQEKVTKDDLVITAGDNRVPPDLALARIEEVLMEKNGVYQKAEVRLLIDPEQLETVFLVTKR
jgi:cell shape-determining protein MreC